MCPQAIIPFKFFIIKRLEVCPLDEEFVRLSDVFLMILFIGLLWLLDSIKLPPTLFPSIFSPFAFLCWKIEDIWLDSLLVLVFSDSFAFLFCCCKSVSLFFKKDSFSAAFSLLLRPFVMLPKLFLLSCWLIIFGGVRGELGPELIKPACAVEADAVGVLRLLEAILLD